MIEWDFMGFNGDFMGFYGDLMGFYSDFSWDSNGDQMG